MSDQAALAKFEAPHPGSQDMPRWDAGELIDAPVFAWRKILLMIGPGLVMGASAIGGGEWLAGPAVTAKYGGSLLWVATISILFQVLYNIEISRYTLYCGEPIFTGKFRTLPGPIFWVVIYLLLDWGSVAPYLATNAAPPLIAAFRGALPDPKLPDDLRLSQVVASCIFGACMLPLIFGGKVYNSLKVVMSFKLVVVVGFLLFLGLLYARPASWWEICSGLFQVGNVPVVTAEDANGNGRFDPGESDFDHDQHPDIVERVIERDAKGVIIRFDDADGDGKWDGDNVENAVLSVALEGRLPAVDWSLIAMIAALAAIAGNGGLTNTPISNFTRDQGWGMGHQVGAIPSMVGGEGITLSHVGCVFEVNDQTLPRWKRWYKHICRDQLCVWMVACLIGVSLPSILSVEFLKRGTGVKDDWNTATLTAGGVEKRIVEPPSDVLASRIGLGAMLGNPTAGRFFWGATLFCGFLVLGTSMASTMDGFIRRWVDVFWTASARLRAMPTNSVRYVYFTVLIGYCVCGFAIIWSPWSPAQIFKAATTGYNFALAMSAWHTLAVNTLLLPPKLRPHWAIRLGLFLAGCYFSFLGVMVTLKFVGVIT